MKEFQQNPSSQVWSDAERVIFDQLKEYESQTGISFDGSKGTVHGQREIVLKRPILIIPFIKRMALIISQPYNPSDVHVLNTKFTDLGQRLREELNLFWEFGESYRAPTERDLELEGLGRIIAGSVVDFKPLPKSRSHREKVERRRRKRLIWKMAQEDFDEFINARN